MPPRRILFRWRLLSCCSAYLILAVIAAAAQPLFTLDAAGYRQKGDRIYLEVYLMMQRDALKFAPADSGWQAAMQISLKLYSPDSLLSTTTWEVVDKAALAAEITPRQKLPDIAIFPQLPPGLYRIEGFVKDLNRDTTFIRSRELDLKPFAGSALCLSDIELATRLEKTDTKNKFAKNGFLVIPDPKRLYGSSLPMLYYYAEIYNLKDTTGSFLVDRVILDSERKEVKRLPQKSHQKVGSSAVEVDGISVASLESGTYFLQLRVEDQEADTAVSRETKFFVFREGDFGRRAAAKTGTLSPDEQYFNSLNDKQLDEEVEALKYLVDDAQARALNQLTEEGKRQFLIRFWRERDDNPATPINEYRQTFEQRKAYANLKFGVLDRDGWKTDRGRIFILYGQPDDIEFHTHELDTRPYEIWHYDAIEGGVIFVFVDRNNFGDYRLVHSTKNGELYRSDWLEQEASIRK